MTFEFLIACYGAEETDIKQSITDLLITVLEDNQYDLEQVDPTGLIQLHYQRDGDEVADDSGATGRRALIGFNVTLPDFVPSGEEDEREREEAEERHNNFMSSVVADFAKDLPDTSPVCHAVKFEDPLLRANLAERAVEIFAVEMKLRRVLSLIYLHAYQNAYSSDNEYQFNLLREETVQIIHNKRPASSDMRQSLENQFFHLLFSQYAGLNQRRTVSNSDIQKMILDSEHYDILRAEISRNPISDGADAGLLAGLRELIDPIERMRNCVAHHRKPSNRVLRNYPTELLGLNELLDEHMIKWETKLLPVPSQLPHPVSPTRNRRFRHAVGWNA